MKRKDQEKNNTNDVFSQKKEIYKITKHEQYVGNKKCKYLFVTVFNILLFQIALFFAKKIKFLLSRARLLKHIFLLYSAAVASSLVCIGMDGCVCVFDSVRVLVYGGSLHIRVDKYIVGRRIHGKVLFSNKKVLYWTNEHIITLPPDSIS